MRNGNGSYNWAQVEQAVLSISTVPVQDRQGVGVGVGVDRATATATATAMPSALARCTYSLTVCEYSHSLTTSNLSLDTLARLVQTVGRQFAEEMAALPAADRHALEIRIAPEPTTLTQEAI